MFNLLNVLFSPSCVFIYELNEMLMYKFKNIQIKNNLQTFLFHYSPLKKC